MQLEKKGILKECQTELLGTSRRSIERAEDRELFKELCEELGEPVLPSAIANTVEDAVKEAGEIGYPVVLRPAFTLGGTGGGFADNEKELLELIDVYKRQTEIYMTPDDVIGSLDTVIHLLGTYDITTIRASIGMYFVCKAIHEQTDIRVLLTGEILSLIHI